MGSCLDPEIIAPSHDNVKTAPFAGSKVQASIETINSSRVMGHADQCELYKIITVGETSQSASKAGKTQAFAKALNGWVDVIGPCLPHRWAGKKAISGPYSPWVLATWPLGLLIASRVPRI